MGGATEEACSSGEMDDCEPDKPDLGSQLQSDNSEAQNHA